MDEELREELLEISRKNLRRRFLALAARTATMTIRDCDAHQQSLDDTRDQLREARAQK